MVDGLSAECQFDSILKMVMTHVAQFGNLTIDHLLAVHQAFSDFMSNMIRKLYLE
jgi:hypothetical protein